MHVSDNETTRQAAVRYCARKLHNSNIDLDDDKAVRRKINEIAQPCRSQRLSDYVDSISYHSFKMLATECANEAIADRRTTRMLILDAIAGNLPFGQPLQRAFDEKYPRLQTDVHVEDWGRRFEGTQMRADHGLEPLRDEDNALVVYLRYELCGGEVVRYATLQIVGLHHFTDEDDEYEVRVVGDLLVEDNRDK